MRYLRSVPVFLLMVFCVLLTGCQSGREKDNYTSRGVDDGIEGFLFNFDQRDVVQSMVRYKNKGQYPVKISWHYLKDFDAETEAVSEPESAESEFVLSAREAFEETETLSEAAVLSETEALTAEAVSPETEAFTDEAVSPETEMLTDEEVSPETETASEETSGKFTMSSEDPALIRDAYFALSNTIIIDVATGHKEDPHYFVIFTLPDGEECRFDFATESILHLGDQNYVLESDGNLWRTLRASEENP